MTKLLTIIAKYNKERMEKGLPSHAMEPLEVTREEWKQLLDESRRRLPDVAQPEDTWYPGMYLGTVFGVPIYLIK